MQLYGNRPLDTPCQPHIDELGWKTIDQLITSETNMMVYKCLFTKASQLSSRRVRKTLADLRKPKKRSKTSQECFPCRGAQASNGLPAEGKAGIIPD